MSSDQVTSLTIRQGYERFLKHAEKVRKLKEKGELKSATSSKEAAKVERLDEILSGRKRVITVITEEEDIEEQKREVSALLGEKDTKTTEECIEEGKAK